MKRKRRGGARKCRAKSKKQKFLSLLRLQFPVDDPKKREMPSNGAASVEDSGSHQLNLFPLHPEHQPDERENVHEHDHENVAYFFSAAEDGADTSLTGILDASTTTASRSSHATADGCSRPEDLSPSSGSLTYAYGGQDKDSRAALVRNALKSRERDSSEEKWVCLSEVVERKVKVKEEEVTSSAVDRRPPPDDRGGIRRLSLKLDYQEILNAWSDKGPLYLHADGSQIVPDINDDNLLPHDTSNHGMGWGCNVGLWTVPEMSKGDVKKGEILIPSNDRDQQDQVIKLMGQREASVLRYKEKRQNRLFSKKIRYQVRKLNAEKRPRLKGRFVKRS